MRMNVAKNGKHYRCDVCQKLLAVEDICDWRDPNGIARHFCSHHHKQTYITERYNPPLFPAMGDQMTGSVIPVKIPGSDK